MATWAEFAEQQPELAEQGRRLLYYFGVGLGFLATVRADGGPRVHPICPILAEDRIYAFIVPSPKQRDLTRDPRCAIHSFPLPDNEDAFYVAGVAEGVADRAMRARVAEQFVRDRADFGVPAPEDAQQLFAFELTSVLLTRTTRHGDPSPRHQVWHSD